MLFYVAGYLAVDQGSVFKGIGTWGKRPPENRRVPSVVALSSPRLTVYISVLTVENTLVCLA